MIQNEKFTLKIAYNSCLVLSLKINKKKLQVAAPFSNKKSLIKFDISR